MAGDTVYPNDLLTECDGAEPYYYNMGFCSPGGEITQYCNTPFTISRGITYFRINHKIYDIAYYKLNFYIIGVGTISVYNISDPTHTGNPDVEEAWPYGT